MESKSKKQKNKKTDDFDDYISDVSDDEVKDVATIKDPFPVDQFGSKDYRTLTMKDDHMARPLWIAPNGKIYFETFSKLRKIAQEFLTAVAEPVSRPEHLHTYRLTNSSLYGAVSSGVKSEDILKYLDKLCKTELPKGIVEYVRSCTQQHGKANLILRHGRMIIESNDVNHLRYLVGMKSISDCFVKDSEGKPIISCESDNAFAEEISNPFVSEDKNEMDMADDVVAFYRNIDKVAEENDMESGGVDLVRKGKISYSIQIDENRLEQVQKKCQDLNAHLLVEYDFRNDTHNPDIRMDLKASTTLRPYQEKSLRKMFGHNRARSGIIVLPCGAGKTLVGVTAACTIRKKCIVFCTGGVAVEQWANHFLQYTTVEKKQICRFTGSMKDPLRSPDVFITTYNLIGYSGHRSLETKEVLDWLNHQEWGLVVLDEVHTIPAKTFRTVVSRVHGHCKLGLTATLVREDNKIDDLNFLVGPKLYEADWMELQDKGFIARVQCMEVRCPMTPEFYLEYLKSPANKQTLLYVMNPEKFRRCEYLIRYHERRGDKIIVFSDNLFALRQYATLMNRFFLEGSTGHDERLRVMDNFRKNCKVNTIFVSKMADVALDLPEATVLIQISSQGASRRQEAQRLGRITRAKKGMRPDEVNAFFYTLISSDTTEQRYSGKRQQFLKDQGYSFKVVTTLDGMSKEDLMYGTKNSQLEMLSKVLAASAEDNEVEGHLLKTQQPTTQKVSSKRKISEQINEVIKRKKLDWSGSDGQLYVDAGAPSNRN